MKCNNIYNDNVIWNSIREKVVFCVVDSYSYVHIRYIHSMVNINAIILNFNNII